jgi:ABC-type branched-subunit amino acid transport system substrate-binding protein
VVKRLFRPAVCVGLTSCVAFAVWATAAAARSGKQAAQPLRAAVVIPKSGEFSIHNRLLANGATIAVNEINIQGAGEGKAPVHLKLKVVSVKPTASASSIVRSLVRASTRVVILPCNVQLQESLARAAAKAGLLTLSPCSPDATFGKGLSRYWQTGPTAAGEVGQLVYYAHFKYSAAKTAYLLGTGGSWYSRQLTPELRTFAKRNKLKIVGQASVPAGSHSVAGLANRIRKANPALVFAAIPSPNVESIITGLRQKGIKSGFFVTDGMDAAINFFRYRDGPVSSSLEQVVFATPGFPRTPTAAGRFYSDYSAAYGKRPVGNFPGLGFETVHVLETAAQRAAALTPAGLNVAFAKGFTVPGVTLEDIRYRGHGHWQPVTSVGLGEVIRDGYVPVLTSLAGHPAG